MRTRLNQIPAITTRPLLAALLLLGACGGALPQTGPSSGPDAGPDAGSDGGSDGDLDGGFDGGSDTGIDAGVVAHVALPVVPFGGGPILSSVDLVGVFSPGDPNVDALKSFNSWISASSWYTTAGKEYGIDAGTSRAFVLDAGYPHPQDDTTEQEQFILAQIAAGNLPRPTAQTLYMFYVPPVPHACDDDLGYHWNFADDAGTTILAAVAINCPPNSADSLKEEQLVVSHELFEAASDPTGTGYVITDQEDAFSSWGGELADLCIMTPDYTPDIKDATTGYYTQRIWSNHSAHASGQPCRPNWDATDMNVSTDRAVRVVNAGGSTSWTLTGWSNPPISSPWKIEAVPLSDGLTLSWTTQQISEGEQIELTVTEPANRPSQSVDTIFLVSYDLTGKYVGYWPLAISVP